MSTGDDKCAKVWRSSDLKFQYSLYGHNNWVNCGRFSPGMRIIGTGSEDLTVKLWDVATKK